MSRQRDKGKANRQMKGSDAPPCTRRHTHVAVTGAKVGVCRTLTSVDVFHDDTARRTAGKERPHLRWGALTAPRNLVFLLVVRLRLVAAAACVTASSHSMLRHAGV